MMSNENETPEPATDAPAMWLTEVKDEHGVVWLDQTGDILGLVNQALTAKYGNPDRIADLEAQLAESKKDTERLDYLEENHEQFTRLIENHSGEMKYFDWWSDNSDWSDSLRQAIDKAMKEGER